MLNLILLSIFLNSGSQKEFSADSIPQPLVEYWNWNQHDLPRNAKTKSNASMGLETLKINQPQVLPDPNFSNQKVSEVYQLPFDVPASKGEFAFEFLVLNHVNQPVGFEMLVQNGERPYFAFTYFNRKLLLGREHSKDWEKIEMDVPRWKSYWTHLLISFQNEILEVYLNGEIASQIHLNPQEHDLRIILKSFLENEPYMEIGDLVKQIGYYDQFLSENDVKQRFEKIKSLIDEGKLYPHKFHFNAGPYLSDINSNKSQLVWETDRPAKAIIHYGESATVENKKEEESGEALIKSVILENLNAGTTYYYKIQCISMDGQQIESPVLTFQTAKPSNEPFMFGIISDTESRPQINMRVGDLLWDERPDFLIHLGDLTDGGQKLRKFEWNMEFFQGVGPLLSRIPIAPVPGNGDADLFWYKKYFPNTGPEAYNRFDYGNASFWMLNSNLKNELQKGGSQYEWLSSELKKSNGKWKFVVLHHAPYSADEDDYGNTWVEKGNMGDAKLSDLADLLETEGVDMVFYGHLHTYMRTHPIFNKSIGENGGTVYIQAGGTGGNLEDHAPTRAWFSAKTFRGHHYSTVQIIGEELELRTYNLEGALIDYFKVKR
ncbi:metallophosphoesterase family protein [Cyclobacteriaceae bacterium YHN15]|nr:metallophosphoesterase family protein [Cyclobacteriaceae bacterium YHN15]